MKWRRERDSGIPGRTGGCKEARRSQEEAEAGRVGRVFLVIVVVVILAPPRSDGPSGSRYVLPSVSSRPPRMRMSHVAHVGVFGIPPPGRSSWARAREQGAVKSSRQAVWIGRGLRCVICCNAHCALRIVQGLSLLIKLSLRVCFLEFAVGSR